MDDGSTDDSLDRLQRWAAERPGRVTVLTKENGGQPTARDLGIEHSRGEWLPFTGPDDVLNLNPTYLAEVDRFLDANPKVPMVATYRVFLDDATGTVRDTHPLRSHFAGKSRLRYLDGWPSDFHGSAPAAFFRRERIIEFGLRVDPDVRPNFEDGHFCVSYLLAEHRPAVGFVKSAVYQYRKRSDASSTLQTSLANPDRYTKVLHNGYRVLLRQSLIGRSRPPEWLQNYVIYAWSWYFTSQDARASTGSSATGSVAEEFQALMAEICPLLDAQVVKSFPSAPNSTEPAVHPAARLCGPPVAFGIRSDRRARQSLAACSRPVLLHRQESRECFDLRRGGSRTRVRQGPRPLYHDRTPVGEGGIDRVGSRSGLSRVVDAILASARHWQRDER